MQIVIQSLVEKRYVHREHSNEDRRKVSLTLTKKGEAKAAGLKKDLFAHFMKVFSVLEEEELDEFYIALEKLLKLSQLMAKRLSKK